MGSIGAREGGGGRGEWREESYCQRGSLFVRRSFSRSYRKEERNKLMKERRNEAIGESDGVGLVGKYGLTAKAGPAVQF